jgi:putative thioredoxin
MSPPDAPRHDGQAGLPFFGRMPSLEREIADFEHDVLDRSRQEPVLAEFWAPWAGPCTTARQRLEELVRKVPGVAHVSVNVEMHPEVITDHGVHGLPMVKLYSGGQALGEVAGVLPVGQLRNWLDGLLSPALRPARARPANGGQRRERRAPSYKLR